MNENSIHVWDVSCNCTVSNNNILKQAKQLQTYRVRFMKDFIATIEIEAGQVATPYSNRMQHFILHKC